MSNPSIISVDPSHPDSDIIMQEADIIQQGDLVAFPTETVYGLGGDGMNPQAVKKVYQAKGRVSDKPLLVLIADPAWLSQLTDVVPDAARAVMDTFWPGPVTLTLPAAPNIPRELLGAGTTIGVRLPGPSVALSLVQSAGCPITAPSANRSGTPDPLTAMDVARSLGDSVDIILDGGPALDDRPSTVVDLSTPKPVLLRAGRVPFEDVLRVWRSYDD